jgi:hypothetical protein
VTHSCPLRPGRRTCIKTPRVGRSVIHQRRAQPRTRPLPRAPVAPLFDGLDDEHAADALLDQVVVYVPVDRNARLLAGAERNELPWATSSGSRDAPRPSGAAFALSRRLPGSQLWRSFTRDAVIDAALQSDGVIIVPMTIARGSYFDETVGAISKRVLLHDFTPMASREEILRREAARPDDTGAWVATTVNRVLAELASSRYAAHLDAEAQLADEIAAQIKHRII